MKIIVEGDASKVLTIRRFECGYCGCVFEADSTEYLTLPVAVVNGKQYSCRCPTCKKDVICVEF